MELRSVLTCTSTRMHSQSGAHSSSTATRPKDDHASASSLTKMRVEVSRQEWRLIKRCYLKYELCSTEHQSESGIPKRKHSQSGVHSSSTATNTRDERASGSSLKRMKVEVRKETDGGIMSSLQSKPCSSTPKRKHRQSGTHNYSKATNTRGKQASASSLKKTKVEFNTGKVRLIKRCPLKRKPCLTKHQSESDTFGSRYAIGEKLGDGSFGNVYKGKRMSDGLKVAIKIVEKKENTRHLYSSEMDRPMPIEAFLHQLVCQQPISNHIVQLLEWFDETERYILVMERFKHCADLQWFIDNKESEVDMERLAQRIMSQVIMAAKHCTQRRVFHRDIKVENILINTRTFEVKLIDFGCGEILYRKSIYREFSGSHVPPEFILTGKYLANPTTVWSLGVLLYRIVCGRNLFAVELLQAQPLFKHNISQECRSLIQWCLHRNPEERPTLKQIMNHEWFQCCSTNQGAN